MNKAIRFICLLFALTLLVPALAQEAEEFDPADFGLYGDVTVGEYEPFEEEEADDLEDGAIVISALTPTDQTANINIIGPDGYREHLEANPEGEEVVEDLLPGVYSVAATDDGLQLAEAKVEVRVGQAIPVTLNLNRLPAAPFDPAEYEPFGTVDIAPAAPLDTAGAAEVETGNIEVDAEADEMVFTVTGPDGYSEDFQGDFVAEAVVPGVYSIAGTAEGYQLVETKVQVEPARIVEVIPTLVVYQPEVGAQQAAAQEDQQAQQERAQEEAGAAAGSESERAQATAATVQVEQGDQYGEYLVDGQGRPLYLFTADSQGSSSCYDDCAQAWPPFTTDGEPTAGEGADASLLGTIERDDGTMQVTYDGHPLYYFVQDQGADTPQGQDVQGFGGEWYLVTPQGQQVEAEGEAQRAQEQQDQSQQDESQQGEPLQQDESPQDESGGTSY